jgi:hypothetical protein
MCCLLYGICSLFVAFGLCAGQQPQERRYTNLVCILDRNGYETIPAGSLYAVMGEFEACMLSFAVALDEREPILISEHIVKNVYDMLKYKGRPDRYFALNTLMSGIPDVVKSKHLNHEGSEIQKATCWLQGSYSPSMERLIKLKKISKFKDTLLKNSTVFKTKTGSLHMLLILPKRGASEEDLRLQGFVPDEFELISKDVLNTYFTRLYDSTDKVVSMSQPLDMGEFRRLFISDHLLGRNIFLLGHGNVGVLAQLSYEKFRQLINMLNTAGCASLSIFSCHAGAQKNLEAYQVPSNFIKIAFSVGDIAARVWGYSGAGQKNFSFSSFFNKLQSYLQQKDLSSPEASRLLCEAVAAIHVNDLHNYPWFCFPNNSTLIHLSELIEKIKQPAPSSAEALPVESMCVVPSQSPGFEVDKDMGIVTKEGYEAALTKGEDLVFENKRALLLHVQCINLPMRILKTVPSFLSMIDVPFYCIDTMNMDRLFFKTLVERLISLRKTCAIKSLLCMNYSGSNIAQNRSGQLLCIKDCIIEPIPDTKLNKTALMRALFRLAEGPYYTLEGFVENECLKNIIRRDGTQASLQAEHTRSIWQLLGTQRISSLAEQILNSMLPQAEESAVIPPIQQSVVQSQPYIERIGEGESIAKRPHRV